MHNVSKATKYYKKITFILFLVHISLWMSVFDTTARYNVNISNVKYK